MTDREKFKRVSIEEMRAKRDEVLALQKLQEEFNSKVNEEIDQHVAEIMREHGVEVPEGARKEVLVSCLDKFEELTGKTIEVNLEPSSNGLKASIYIQQIAPQKVLLFKPTIQK